MKATASEAVLFIFQLPMMRGLRTSVSRVINKGCELSRMLKKSASREKAEVQAKVEVKIKNIRSSLNLDLSLPSLAAALLDGLFEHPAGLCPVLPRMRTAGCRACHNSYSAVCPATRRLRDSIGEGGQARELFAFQ